MNTIDRITASVISLIEGDGYRTVKAFDGDYVQDGGAVAVDIASWSEPHPGLGIYQFEVRVSAVTLVEDDPDGSGINRIICAVMEKVSGIFPDCFDEELGVVGVTPGGAQIQNDAEKRVWIKGLTLYCSGIEFVAE